jgi:hypothetical protein
MLLFFIEVLVPSKKSGWSLVYRLTFGAVLTGIVFFIFLLLFIQYHKNICTAEFKI